MDNHGLDILALSEVRWTGAGSQTLKKGSTILHSGTEKRKKQAIIVARFTGRQAKLTVVACYAPTNEADDTTKDNFYNTLQAVAKDIPSHDLVCFVGDFNAKVGSDKSYCPEVLGSQGLGEINENGILNTCILSHHVKDISAATLMVSPFLLLIFSSAVEIEQRIESEKQKEKLKKILVDIKIKAEVGCMAYSRVQ
ncbi:hypothetical protein QYM36_014619 [Artemia franciscana]|uniref:Endonuclease/exonuclease/phosphatase domain-containing protein n=1 Tax=Artemia franciscana TaxID=6661 RepID=A0AA88KVU4_ARTSF|nr:hypothetical protein QYM36_014619 [Artemia franciscana]